MPGPSADVEFMRTDLAPRICAPSSHFFPMSTPALRSASSGPTPDSSARCSRCAGTSTPVAACFAAIFSSHFRPDGLDGLNAARREHAVVGHVAEQPRKDVHVRDARERVLRELREVQHRDLAVLLLHLRARHARVRVRLLPAAAPARPPAPA